MQLSSLVVRVGVCCIALLTFAVGNDENLSLSVPEKNMQDSV
nr:uncharacterized protein CTRU02_04393 [Colletotrichum truncatum]KAF6795583.1 hypothetical protein CTRU02_04393 [Colletotrichum truncatum]